MDSGQREAELSPAAAYILTSKLPFGKKSAVCAGSIKQGCLKAVVLQSGMGILTLDPAV